MTAKHRLTKQQRIVLTLACYCRAISFLPDGARKHGFAVFRRRGRLYVIRACPSIGLRLERLGFLHLVPGIVGCWYAITDIGRNEL